MVLAMKPVEGSEAFALFYEQNHGAVFRALLVGTRNREAAEDAAAEAFARALVFWSAIASHSNPRAWVLRVAWNYHKSEWRKWEHRRVDDPTESRLIPEPATDRDMIVAIRRLPRGQREVLALVAFCGLTPAEIAEVLGQTAGTVRGQLSRARAALRKALDEAGSTEVRDV